MFGQRRTAIEMLIQLGPFILIVPIIILRPIITSAENAYLVLIATIGFTLFFISKWATLKNKQFFNFGPKEMTARDRKFYFIGYAMMILSVAILITKHIKQSH